MSTVTNIIITALMDEQEEVLFLKHLNKYSLSKPFRFFPPKYVAGSKNLECSLFIGAFNYMDEEALIKLLKDSKNIIGKLAFDDLQLIIKRQWEDKFSIINIAEL